MKILIDYTQIPRQKVGVGVYASNLIEGLQQIDNEHDYIILIQSDETELHIYNKRFKTVKVPSLLFRNFFLRFFLEQFFIPVLCLTHKIDVLHSLHYSLPLIPLKTKKIVTIHDLTFYLFPELHQYVKRYYFRFFTKASVKLADKVICVSQSTLNDLKKVLKNEVPNATVVHLATSGIYRPNYSKSEIEHVKTIYKIKGDYVLFIGTLEPRKNIETLIKAFFKFLRVSQNTSLKLVIVGKKGWYYKSIFKLVNNSSEKSKVVFTDFIPEEHKPILLNGCQSFAYTSLYEGFGIPILEALACGKPVITSNLSSMPEVAGEAAILVNPYNENEIQHSIAILNQMDDKSKETVKSRALEQASKFSWKNTASKTLAVYSG